MMLTNRLLLGIGLATVILFCGCSGGPKTIPVTGAVTFDGAPLPVGNITFIPADASQPPQGGEIKDGKYEIKALAGKNRVEISASRVVPGGAKGAMGEDVAEEYIPVKYNAETTLSADVTAGGPNKFDYPLDSK